jgi:hypothetical protein
MTQDIYTKLFELKAKWITLTRDTKAFNYKYATLDQIQSKLWWFLQELKLIIVHQVKDNKVVTDIRDIESNTFVTSEIEINTTKPQDKGSEITYYRRYNLLSLLDLEVEDDDGKTAQDSKPVYEDNDLPWINAENIANIKDLMEKWRNFTFSEVKEKYKISKANKEILNNLWIV